MQYIHCNTDSKEDPSVSTQTHSPQLLTRGRGRGRRGRGRASRSRGTGRPTQGTGRAMMDNHKSVITTTVAAIQESWQEIDPIVDPEPAPLPFHRAGRKLPPDMADTPAEFFHLVFRNDVINLVIGETNR